MWKVLLAVASAGVLAVSACAGNAPPPSEQGYYRNAVDDAYDARAAYEARVRRYAAYKQQLRVQQWEAVRQRAREQAAELQRQQAIRDAAIQRRWQRYP
ncbi:MAG TPA: hypothetical protein VKB51_17080 [bacterium]|nr:hypothetical protein [bacterium]